MGQLPRFACVCFDFDSTLSRLEGIDELAVRAGVESQIAPLTTAAMEGTISIESVYGKRLELIRPDRAAIEWLGRRYMEDVVPGAEATIAAVQRAGTPVYIISGGIRPAILPFAKANGIASQNVYAVDINFSNDGTYEDFEQDSPLTKASGKAVICKMLIDRHGPLVLIGDGVTDVSARSAGAHVIGFGGVAARPSVRDQADEFVDGPDLTDMLPLLFK